MKKKILSAVTAILDIYMFFAMIFGIFGFFGKSYNSENQSDSSKNDESIDASVEIKLKRGDSVEKMSLQKYLFGVVAAEMPASFENEALKAQAVAARTYTKSKSGKNIPEHPDADACDDINHCKAYISEQELREKYGDDWMRDYYPKIKNAVTETDGIIAEYNGEPITAVFHSTSSGMTENSKDVWSGDLPYLVSVVSEGEEESPRYSDTVTLSAEEFKKKIEKSEKNTVFSENPSEWLGEIKRNESGSVRTVEIGGESFKGTEVRELLSLRSANFEIKLGDNVVISTKGNGHGVGMSQYGANYMAKRGYSFEQILKKYYTGITLEKMSR